MVFHTDIEFEIVQSDLCCSTCVQCFDSVGRVTGRTSELLKGQLEEYTFGILVSKGIKYI